MEMTNLLNWWQMRRSGLSGWREKVRHRLRSLTLSVPPKQKELTLIHHPGIINYGGSL
ncbi:MAG: hypothetical protein V7L27_01040 [Nostoc sp.]|uniref:hypothetical protein n=1 Tax=Nostoc sp. TaxID=1180 RepID=UPI002FFB8554